MVGLSPPFRKLRLHKLLPHLRSVVLSIFGRPSFTPWATARLRPALSRWRMMLRSNSAKDGGGDRPVQEILGDLQEPKL